MDFVDVVGALAATLALVGDVLTRDAQVAARLSSADLLWPALGVAVLAWVSIGAGQSSVLFLNRISPLRLVIAGAVGLAYVALLRSVEALVTWGVAWVVTGRALDVETVVTVFLLAMAPHVFSVLTFLPHVGLGIGRILEGWSFLILFLLLGAVYGIAGWHALLITASGWLVMHLLSRLLAAPLGWLGSWAWTVASGQPVLVTAHDILAGTPFVPVDVSLPATDRSTGEA